MYRSIFLVFCFALISFITWSNPVDTTKIRKYYELTNRAELAIVDSVYNTANTLYNKAFKMKEANGTDLFNAFVVAYISKDTAAVKDHVNKLILHGMRLDVLEHSYFGKLVNNEPFFKFVTSNYDSLREVCLKSEKPVLASILDTIFDNDQRARSGSLDHMEEIDGRNIDDLCSYVQNFGFPSFDKVGVMEKRTITVGNFGAFSMVMWHKRGSTTKLNPIAHKAVINGEYPPNEYAMITDMESPKYYMILPESGEKIIANSASTKEDVPDEKIINRNRSAIYLESLDDYRKKLKFLQTDQRFIMEPVFALMFNNGKIERK